MKLKNTTTGPRGVYVDGVLRMIEPGATVEGVTKDEAESVKDWFAIEEAPKPVTKPQPKPRASDKEG